MRIELDNGAVLATDANGIGTYSDNFRSANVKLLAMDPEGAGMTIQRLSDMAVFQQKGFREVRQNISTKQYRPPRYLAQGIDVRRAFPARGLKIDGRQRGQSRAIAPEFQPGPGAGWIFRKESLAQGPPSSSQPWMLSSSGRLAPQALGDEVVLIDTIVPLWARMRITAHTQFLEDGSAHEDNLTWFLRLGGMDILNPFEVSDFYHSGRVLRSNNSVIPFAAEINDMLIIGPGTRIQYVVRGINAIAANVDHIAASVIGTLWGDKT